MLERVVRSHRRRADRDAVAIALALSLALAAKAEAQAECTTVTPNTTCVVTINREVPVSPLPIKINSMSQVTISVNKRPTEKIEFDVALADTIPPDPLAAIFNAFVTPVAALVTSAGVAPLPAIPPAPAAAPGVPPPPAPPPPSPRERVERALDEIINDQRSLETQLTSLEADITALGNLLGAFQARHAGDWTPPEFTMFRSNFNCSVSGSSGVACAFGFPAGGVARRGLPIGLLGALDVMIEDATKAYAALPSVDRTALATKMSLAGSLQSQLTASVKSLKAAQDALIDAQTTLNGITTVTVNDNRVIGGFSAHTNRTATVKLSAKNLITGKSVDLGTVVVQWGGTSWEVSGGAIFSFLQARSFANAPIIENGKSVVDDKGAVRTRIVETDTRPMVIPAVFAHYRWGNGFRAGGQRLAILTSGGIGVNPYSKSADFTLSPLTFSYRGLMVMPSLHFVRDEQLTAGLAPGMELGADPPDLPTERHWVRKFAIALGYRIPIN